MGASEERGRYSGAEGQAADSVIYTAVGRKTKTIGYDKDAGVGRNSATWRRERKQEENQVGARRDARLRDTSMKGTEMWSSTRLRGDRDRERKRETGDETNEERRSSGSSLSEREVASGAQRCGEREKDFPER